MRSATTEDMPSIMYMIQVIIKTIGVGYIDVFHLYRV